MNETFVVPAGKIKQQVIQENKFVPEFFDAITNVASPTTDVYSYRVGGATGTIVATVSVTFTDSTKTTILSVIKT